MGDASFAIAGVTGGPPHNIVGRTGCALCSDACPTCRDLGQRFDPLPTRPTHAYGNT